MHHLSIVYSKDVLRLAWLFINKINTLKFEMKGGNSKILGEFI